MSIVSHLNPFFYSSCVTIFLNMRDIFLLQLALFLTRVPFFTLSASQYFSNMRYIFLLQWVLLLTRVPYFTLPVSWYPSLYQRYSPIPNELLLIGVIFFAPIARVNYTYMESYYLIHWDGDRVIGLNHVNIASINQ